MAADFSQVKQLLADALDVSPADRAAWLQEAAPDDATRAQVEKLLLAHDRATATFLPEAEPIDPLPAERIGPYRLVARLGEGGFGEVYLAEQLQPIRREVALKLVRPGMDSRQVLARFEAERQSLAMMEHPSIARVFDAGKVPADPPTAVSGRPYFVMELVRDGEPITAFCDSHQIGLEARLRLFAQVCRAVAHAHQKGVIHRDLKPANILVSAHEEAPMPKVIDFGVAKAIDSRSGTATVFTEVRQLVGTPQYMSPEQAGHGPAVVDTRSDIFSLGAVLFELIAGSPPIEPKTLEGESGIDAMTRALSEGEVIRPSDRLAHSPTLSNLARTRAIDPTRLLRAVRGELDWIVGRCLERDPGRRYETATALAEDVEAYLTGLPVRASPPSRMYRLRKLARRHRAAVSAVMVAAIAIVVAIIALVIGFRTARHQERVALAALADAREARALAETRATEATTQRVAAERSGRVAEAVNRFLAGMLRSADPMRGGAKDVTIRTALDNARDRVDKEFAALPEVEAAVRLTLGRTYLALGELRIAVEQIRRSTELGRQVYGEDGSWTITADASLASVLNAQGEVEQAATLARSVLDRSRRINGPNSPSTLTATNNLGLMLVDLQKYDEAIPLLETALASRKALLGPDHPDVLQSLANLAMALSNTARAMESLPIYLDAIRVCEAQYGPADPHTLQIKNNYAATLAELGRFAEAEPILDSVSQATAKQLGEDHPATLEAGSNLADARWHLGRTAEAIAALERIVPKAEKLLGPNHKVTVTSRADLARARAATNPSSQATSRPATRP
jgi:eukaryotic-like serine/threonine-protein kinase